MPVNLRTHAHGQGYTYLNFLVPELISRVDVFNLFIAETNDITYYCYTSRLPGEPTEA